MSFGGGGTTTHVEKGKVDDLQSIIGGSQYGANIAQIRGTARVAGNLIWAAKPVERITQTSETISGGKGGDGGEVTTVTTTYTYTCSFAVMLCAGPIYGISKIWAGGVLIYDMSDTATPGSVAASNDLLNNRLTIYTGTNTQGQDPTIVSAKGAANTPAYRGRAYMVFRDLDLTPYNNRIPPFQAEVVEYGQLFGGNQITRLKRSVGAILLELCQRAGIPTANVDVSQLIDEVYGVSLSSGSYRDMAQHLIDAFAIRPIVSGSKVRFLPSTMNAVDISVPSEDLGATTGGIAKRLEITHKRDHALPRKVSVTYSDINRQDERSTQTRQRMTPGASSNDVSIDLPMVLDATGAARIAETILFRKWAERDSYEFTLGPKYLKADPGDVLSITDGATTHKVRAKSISYGYNGLIRISGIAFEPSVSSSAATGAAGGGVAPSIPEIGSTTLHLLDVPALRDDVAGPGFAWAATGAAIGWKSATLYHSVDSGANYSAIGRLQAKSSIGTADTALGNAPALGSTYWDDVSTVDVTMLYGQLESLSDALVYAGGNAAMLGNEVIQYGTATLIGAGKYRISHLLRGRRGTEWAMSGHAAGERFVMLATCGWVPLQTADLNSTRLYKAVPDGQRIADVGATSFTWSGEVLRPFSPVQAKASRDGSGNITLTWIRRSRLGQEMPSGADIQLGETSELYEVDVINGAGNLMRTITATTVSATYSAANQTTDFGSAQASVRFRIYQISQSVGRGRVLDVTL